MSDGRACGDVINLAQAGCSQLFFSVLVASFTSCMLTMAFTTANMRVAPVAGKVCTGRPARVVAFAGMKPVAAMRLASRTMPVESMRTAVKAARRTTVVAMAKKSVGDLKQADLEGKTVFVRCDLNVPLDKDLNITDDTRIRAAVPTLKYLMDNGAKLLVTSHLVCR